MSIQKKLVIVGSVYAKIDLLYAFDTGIFFPNLHKVYTEKYPSEICIQIDDQIVEFNITNVCYRPEYERLRPMGYHNSDVILACFSLDKPSSLYYLLEKFLVEAKKYCPDSPIILVGLKSDLRNERLDLVSVEEALRVAVKLGATDYIECSPKMNFNVGTVFKRAAQLALTEKLKKRKKKKRCCCLV